MCSGSVIPVFHSLSLALADYQVTVVTMSTSPTSCSDFSELESASETTESQTSTDPTTEYTLSSTAAAELTTVATGALTMSATGTAAAAELTTIATGALTMSATGTAAAATSGPALEPRTRKRVRKESQWKKSKRKLFRNTRQAYISARSKAVEARQCSNTPCGCPLKCFEKVGKG